jgi:hypothetical protein
MVNCTIYRLRGHVRHHQCIGDLPPTQHARERELTDNPVFKQDASVVEIAAAGSKVQFADNTLKRTSSQF